ncbi:hypothetical protein [uncultured Pseudoramibacter sp.]|uniref:hypothetical protein n=1 Tax=uncultured Pseudoramibacter sp. TaxID=1623493 RepID=UPI0025EF40E9|nr:hypothetical protein [uncultured Pseudoramibacter sp.]
MKEFDAYRDLIERTKYAINSDNRDIVYEVYGEARMALQLGAISFDQYFKINAVLIRCYLNGGANRKKKALKQIEETEW